MKLINKNEIFLLEEIVKKNFSSKYKDSVLGILWTILNPLLIMGLFTIIFSTLFNRNIDNYSIYFLCGWCVVSFFNKSIATSMTALKGNKNILQKVPAPKHIFVLGSIISETLNFIITLILLGVVMVVTHAPFYWMTIPISIIPIIFLFIMCIGFGLIFAILCVYYSDIQYLWSVLSLLLFYSSAVFYPMNIIPWTYRRFLILNPLYWVVDQFRCCVYHGILPAPLYLLNLFLFSLIVFVFGLIVFKKFENRINMKL